MSFFAHVKGLFTGGNRWYALISLLLTITILQFVAQEVTLLSPLRPYFLGKTITYALFVLLGGGLIASISIREPNLRFFESVKKAWFWLLLPAGLFTLAYLNDQDFPLLFKIATGLYWMSAGLYFALLFILDHRQEFHIPTLEQLSWRSHVMPFLVSLLFVASFLFFGLRDLGKFAAVDEPLWLFGRIEKYFNNIADGEFRKTRVSDKPGITVSLISGVGLLSYSPQDFKVLKYQGELENSPKNIEKFFFAFRVPIVIFTAIALLLLYWPLTRVFGRWVGTATLGMLSLSPVLIGMAQIINPDSLLWIFTSFSLLFFILSQNTPRRRTPLLLLTGFTFGLSLLTKYVSNILLIYYIAFFVLNLLMTPLGTRESLSLRLSRFIEDILFILFVALFTFFVILPATWVEPSFLLTSTFLSQAFEKFSFLFLVLVILSILEVRLNHARFLYRLLNILRPFQIPLALLFFLLFFGSMLYTALHVALGMPTYNFVDLLSSPKTIKGATGVLGIYLSNFFILIYTQTWPVLLGLTLLFITWPLTLRHKDTFTARSLPFLALFFMTTILLYFLGSIFNGVGSIIRYQIILTPFAIFLAAIGYALSLSWLHKHARIPLPVMATLILASILVSGWVILLKTPYPGSYASPFLPNQYYTDVKDMGTGSYAMAVWLNTLPDAANTTVWTDKSGLCRFYIGRCLSGTGPTTLADPTIDYVVVSSTRQNRTTAITKGRVNKHPEYVPIPSFYTRTDIAAHTILINDRPNHFVKAFAYQAPITPEEEARVEATTPTDSIIDESSESEE